MKRNVILQGDALAGLRTLPDESVDMCMTSPPYYWLRNYGTDPLIWDGDPQCQHEWENTNTRMHNGRGDAQKGAKYSEQEPIPDKLIPHASCLKCGAWKGSLGLEPTPELYTKHLCDIFDQVRRVLKDTGTCWVNLGDSRKQKCLLQIPSRFAVAMTSGGWILRSEIIWWKRSVKPESVRDRFTVDFEKLFLFSKSPRYYFKRQHEPLSAAYLKRSEAVRRNNEVYDPARHKTDKSGMAQSGMGILVRTAMKGDNPLGRNKRCVWMVNPTPFKEAHYATYPEALCEVPIDAGCPPGGLVLDPFFGAATTGLVALKQGKDFVGVELNADYIKIAAKRLAPHMPLIFVE